MRFMFPSWIRSWYNKSYPPGTVFSAFVTFKADSVEHADRILQMLRLKVIEKELTSKPFPFQAADASLMTLEIEEESKTSMLIATQPQPKYELKIMVKLKSFFTGLKRFIREGGWIILLILAVFGFLLALAMWADNNAAIKLQPYFEIDISGCENIGTAIDKGDGTRFHTIYKCSDGKLHIR